MLIPASAQRAPKASPKGEIANPIDRALALIDRRIESFRSIDSGYGVQSVLLNKRVLKKTNYCPYRSDKTYQDHYY